MPRSKGIPGTFGVRPRRKGIPGHLQVRPRLPAFTPYHAPPVPTGSYDPTIDAELRASHRGLRDIRADSHLADVRDTVDYGLRSEDITRTRDRGLEDFATQRSQLARSYSLLANRQGQSINAAGTLGGGASLQAAAKRALNQGIDSQPIITGETRTRENADTALGDLGLEYQRRGEDRATSLARARREDLQFGIDAGALRNYQAAATGYAPPGRGEAGGIPANEHVGPLGHHTQVHVVNGRRYFVRPDGSVARVEDVDPRRRRGGITHGSF